MKKTIIKASIIYVILFAVTLFLTYLESAKVYRSVDYSKVDSCMQVYGK